MAFLFPKFFPGCVTTGGFGVNLSLTDAMALYWKPIALQLQATCTETLTGNTFSINRTITNAQILDDLVCGGGVAYNGTDISYFFVGSSAFQQGDLYMPGFLMQFVLRDGSGSGRVCIADTNQLYPYNGNLSFLNGSIPVTFFNDDDPGQPHTGSGSLSIISERTFD
jgi:hypothetical protein